MDIIRWSAYNLPVDLILEILTWVSLETLYQCRLASEEINNYTNLSYFMNLFVQRTRAFSGYIVEIFQRRELVVKFISCVEHLAVVESLSMNFLPEKVTIKAVVNDQGLLFCAYRMHNAFYVCKPTTEEWVKIKKLKTRFVTTAFGIVVLETRPLRYVIVRFSHSMNHEPSDYSNFCEIFDSATRIWNRCISIKFNRNTFLEDARSTVHNGIMHWLTTKCELFSYDVVEESWKLENLPPELVNEECYSGGKKLVCLNGKLTVLNYCKCYVSVWVMVDFSRRIWLKQRMVKGRDDIDLHTSDVEVRLGDQRLIIRSLTDGTSTVVHVGGSVVYRGFLRFASDYERVF